MLNGSRTLSCKAEARSSSIGPNWLIHGLPSILASGAKRIGTSNRCQAEYRIQSRFSLPGKRCISSIACATSPAMAKASRREVTSR